MRRLAAAALIGGCLVAFPTAAGAQTPPTPTATVTPSPVPTDVPAVPANTYCPYAPTPGLLGIGNTNLVPPPPVRDANGNLSFPDPMTVCAQQYGQRKAHDAAKTAMDGVMPDETGSKIPMSAYDVGSSSAVSKGGNLVWGLIMGFCFTASVWLVMAGLMVLTLAVKFPFAAIGAKVANEISNLLLTRIIMPIGLGRFALLLCAFVAAVYLFRGKAGKALKEVAGSMLALILAAFIIANPGAILRSMFKVEADLTGSLVSLAHTGSDTSSDPLAALKAAVVDITVARPYDLINWGAQLTGRCAAVRDEALALGPWGDADAPRQTMAKVPECQAAAAFNENPTLFRALSAVANLLNSVMSSALQILMGLVLLVAEIAEVGLLAVAVLAVVSAIMPGPLRSFAWRWVEAVFRALFVVMVSGALLAFWILMVTSLLDQMGSVAIFVRFLVMAAVTGFTIYLLVSALKRAPKVARNVVKSMEGKGGGWAESRTSHGGAFALGLGGSLGYAEMQAHTAKLRRMMPGGGQRKDFEDPGRWSLKGESDAVNALDPAKEPFDLVDAPKGPGALSTTVWAQGDGKWRAAQHVDAERVPGRTDNERTKEALRDAQRHLANPYARPVVRLPESNPQKVLVALPAGGEGSPDAPPRRVPVEWFPPGEGAR